MQTTSTILPPNIMLSPVAVYASQGNIYALELSSGTLRQSYYVQGLASPTVVNDVLYINVNNLSDNAVQALRISDGAPLWSYKVKGRPSGSPTVKDGVIYTNTAEGYVYALQANDGSLLWYYETCPFLFGPPLVVDEVVYVSPAVNHPSKPSVYALQVKDGTLLWRSHIPSSTSFSLVDMDGVIYISTDNSCCALRMSDGFQLWQQRIPGLLRSSPVVVDSVVCISFSLFGSDVVPETGEVKNKHDAFLCTLQASDGSLLWQQQIGIATGASNPTTPTIAHDVVYVGADDGYLYALHVSNGTPLWSYQTNGLLLSSPVVANGMVFVGANDGHVYALYADNGSPLW